MNDTIKKYENENIDTLGAESLREYCAALKSELLKMTDMEVQAYRKGQILRHAIDFIIEKHGIDMGDVYTALAEGNNYTLDDVLYYLSK